MVIAILAVLVIALALVLFKIAALPIAMALAVAGTLGVVALGERRDRGRQRGIADPGRHFDSNRGVLAESAEPEPTEYAAMTQTEANIATQPSRRHEP